ncbi:MAG: hypothetical protein MHMPM18_002262, partial [Marteilia pararefringens]
HLKNTVAILVQLTTEEIEEILRRSQQDTQIPSFNKKLASLPNGVREQIDLSPSIRVMLPSAKTALLDLCISDLIFIQRIPQPSDYKTISLAVCNGYKIFVIGQ